MTSVSTGRTVAGAREAQWFRFWFDSPHYHRLYARRDDAEAAGFVDRLTERLRPAPASDALDLGCGAGRHSRQLASRGFRVTGLDLAASSIRAARQWERPGLRFRRHDMREPFGRSMFDYVFNFFTSFGYFETPAQHLAVVRNMADALRPGGRLVLDYLNVAYAEEHLVPQETQRIDGVTYRMTRWIDGGHLLKRIVIEDWSARSPIIVVERVARFSLQDFSRMFSVHGLRVEETYGDYRLNAYDAARSPRMILIATRTTSARVVPAAGASPECLPLAS